MDSLTKMTKLSFQDKELLEVLKKTRIFKAVLTIVKILLAANPLYTLNRIFSKLNMKIIAISDLQQHHQLLIS